MLVYQRVTMVPKRHPKLQRVSAEVPRSCGDLGEMVSAAVERVLKRLRAWPMRREDISIELMCDM